MARITTWYGTGRDYALIYCVIALLLLFEEVERKVERV